ncbi:hypothetical protein [Aequorivita marina]|uniref:hypothetical protein n=1 Tax=Aequorivita marina TaxID=3073654 RepID=UPI002876A9BC|nr:hypothetical protein [Aequorivita sp. S2608]MDS1298036.1 hypothetical protein [Aequorivita sp. S2608]
MKLLQKRIYSKIYYITILFKKAFTFKDNEFSTGSIDYLIKKYSAKEKIIIVCNGPSVLTLKEKSNKNLYLVTNKGKELVEHQDFLYYVNDGFFIRKILSRSKFLKFNQEVLFYYNNSEPHKRGFEYLMKNICLLKNKNKVFISRELNDANSISNFDTFEKFYFDRNLPIKIQNSGVFILLFGYFLATRMNLPIEIYGLDLGEGGKRHYDNKGVVGKSVIEDRVKRNVKMYLDYMYKESLSIKNYSNFNPN